MLKSLSIKREATKPQKVLTQQRSPHALCLNVMASNTTVSLQLKLFRDFDFGLRTSVEPRVDFRRAKHDDVIKICHSPIAKFNSANIYFWPLGGHFTKYNSCQIFRLYSTCPLYKTFLTVISVFISDATSTRSTPSVASFGGCCLASFGARGCTTTLGT